MAPLVLFSVVLLIQYLPSSLARQQTQGSNSASSQRSGRFLGLLGILAGERNAAFQFDYYLTMFQSPSGVSNGLFLDTDYYSDEDATDVKVKTKFENRFPTGQANTNWAYIPVPYFITPQQFYHNLFAHQAQFLQPSPVAAGSLPAVNFPTVLAHEDPNTAQLTNPQVVQLDTGSVKTDARGRLTRQAFKAQEDEEDEQEDVEQAAAEVENVAASNSTSNTTTTTTEEMKEITTQAAVTELPSTADYTTSSGIITTGNTTATTPESFEVGEWEYLNNGTVNIQESSKSNQTSSYYRSPSPFDPDKVSFTTWYPEAAAIVASPFRPSEEYNENSLFHPVAGPSTGTAQQLNNFPYQ